MSREPAAAGPPRFHSSPFSWAKPRTGPAVRHPRAADGPSGQRPVQRHTWLLAWEAGRRATSERGDPEEPQALRSIVAASAAVVTATDDSLVARWGRLT